MEIVFNYVDTTNGIDVNSESRCGCLDFFLSVTKVRFKCSVAMVFD